MEGVNSIYQIPDNRQQTTDNKPIDELDKTKTTDRDVDTHTNPGGVYVVAISDSLSMYTDTNRIADSLISELADP